MDNNAFRALVNSQRSSEKSTKEIAREAVENEFRQKKQLRGGNICRRGRVRDYDSDSGSDDDDEDVNKRSRGDDDKKNEDDTANEPEWKRRRKEKGTTVAPEYRDRAKERREGKNSDYNEVAATNNDSIIMQLRNDDEYADDRKRQAELSKFLGGDEEHTHLVKGLDLALAQKVRRDEMAGGASSSLDDNKDLDQLLEDAYIQNKKSTISSKSNLNSSIATIQSKSELGKSVQNYLLQQQQQRHNNPTTTSVTSLQSNIKINRTKQKSILKSHFTFSLESNIQKRKNAWDVPQLKISALFGSDNNSGLHDESFESRRGMTPLDCHLIATIKKKLDDVNGGKRKGVNGGVERGVENSDQKKQPCSSVDKECDGKEQAHSKTPAQSPLSSNKKDVNHDSDSDSDDDIFVDVGAYVPPTAAAATASQTAAPATDDTNTAQSNDDTSTASTTAPKKLSIFDNLINDVNNESQKQQPMQLQHRQQQNHETQMNPNNNVIDRDVFGGERKQDQQQQQQVTKRRGPQTAAMEGVSMTNYEGGYGEEMDTDFLNEEEDYRRKDDEDDEEGEKDGDDEGADDDDDE